MPALKNLDSYLAGIFCYVGWGKSSVVAIIMSHKGGLIPGL